jgi:hypothetical protein
VHENSLECGSLRRGVELAAEKPFSLGFISAAFIKLMNYKHLSSFTVVEVQFKVSQV